MALPTRTSGKDPDPAAPAVIGRTAERQRIDHAVDQLMATRTAAIVEVVGEPGIGKSTLLGVLAASASARGARVLHGRANELDGDAPFAMFVDALDGYLAGLERRHVQRLLDEDGGDLAAIFPALAGRAPRAEPAAGERFRRHRAVRGLLERIATQTPAVLILDDAHWADPASAELIGALLRKPPQAAGMLALAYRPRQTPARLSAELEAAAQDGLIERIDVGPLSREEAGELLGPVADERAGAAFYSASGGNPFYLRQLARTAGAPAPADRSASQLDVPAAVSAALFAELDQLPADARALAAAAAVAGDPFDPDLAAEIGELDQAAALDALDDLLAADVVRQGDEPRSFVFRHPLVRRVVYDAAPAGWRIGAHARADAALARRGAAPALRAHHVEQSAPPGDDAAVDLLAAAAATAPTPVTAARWLRAAVRLAPGARRAELLPPLGGALALSGRFDEGRDVLVEALALAPAIPLVVACAGIERMLGRHEEARARLLDADRALPDAASPSAVALAIELTAGALYTADMDGMASASATALERATALGDDALLAAATAVRSAACFQRGDHDSSRAHADAAAALAERADTARAPGVWLDTLFHLGWTEFFLERFARTADHLGRALDIARATGAERVYVESAAGRAVAQTELGLLAEARESAEAAVESARLSSNPQKVAWALIARATVATADGDLETALRDGAEAVDLARAVEAPTIAAQCGRTMAAALMEAGDHGAAIEVLLELQGGADLGDTFPSRHALVAGLMTRAELGRGDVAAARGWAARAVEHAERTELAAPRAHAALAQASVLLADGDPAAAAAQAARGVELSESTGARLDTARARLVAGRALAAAGDRVRAGDELRIAETEFAACGARRLREEAVRELRAIGRRVTRAGQRGDGSAQGLAALSGREREIADLVRDRLTNRQIGAELFLSQKTVETHLRNVFVKLGVDSRVAVARLIEQAGDR